MTPFKFPVAQTLAEQSSQQMAYQQGYDDALSAARHEQQSMEERIRQEYQRQLQAEKDRIVRECHQQKADELAQLKNLWEGQQSTRDCDLANEVYALLEQLLHCLLSDEVVPDLLRVKSRIKEAVEEIQDHYLVTRIDLPLSYQGSFADDAASIDEKHVIDWHFSDTLSAGQAIIHTVHQQHRLDHQASIQKVLEDVKSCLLMPATTFDT